MSIFPSYVSMLGTSTVMPGTRYVESYVQVPVTGTAPNWFSVTLAPRSALARAFFALGSTILCHTKEQYSKDNLYTKVRAFILVALK